MATCKPCNPDQLMLCDEMTPREHFARLYQIIKEANQQKTTKTGKTVMDEIDRAQNQELMQTNQAIQAAKQQGFTKIKHDGSCHHCGDDVIEPKLFCDGNCASKWELRNKRP